MQHLKETAYPSVRTWTDHNELHNGIKGHTGWRVQIVCPPKIKRTDIFSVEYYLAGCSLLWAGYVTRMPRAGYPKGPCFRGYTRGG